MTLRDRAGAAEIRLPRNYRFGATAASLLALLAFAPQAALAQASDGDASTDQAENAKKQPGDDGDVIVVSGFRSSLETSINTKRAETSIVEAVSAEDIGKLPDVSVAESIARLPGLAAQRVAGRAQIISVRGLAPDFTTVLLNGRQQASSGYNRAVEFDQYPSELMSSVVVYKTPDASIAGMGLAGSVDLRTVRPLSAGANSGFAVNIRGMYDEGGGRNQDKSQWGGRGSISYVGQNADGTLGWAIGYAHLDAPSHVDHFKAYGYEKFDFAVSPDSADNALQLNGQEVFAVNSRDRRDGVMGTLEWQPSDQVHSVLDLYYSRFKQSQVSRGAQWFSNGWADNATFTNVETTDVGGSELGSSGHFTNAVPILRNDSNERKDELFSIGLNNEFALDDRTHFIADLSYSSNTRDETYIETYGGYGVGPFGTRTTDSYDFDIPLDGYPQYSNFGLDYADASQVSLGDRAPWGGWGHDGLLKKPHIKETVGAIDLGFTHDLDGFFSGFEVGVNYTHRNKRKTVDEIDLFLKNSRAQVLVGSQYLIAPTSLGFTGFGNVIAWNVPSALDSYYDQVQLQDANHFDKSWEITEDILTLRAKLTIDAGALHGNLGLQVIPQYQASDGLRINATVSPIVVGDVHVTAEYTDVLPSLNLFYDLGGGHRIRFAAAKVMARPRMDDMRANMTPSYSNPCASGGSNNTDCQPGGTVHPWSASGGNPNLEPWRAKAVDVAYEWYGGSATYFSVAGFYKWIDTYIYTQQLTADFSGFPAPPTATPLPAGVTASPIGVLTAPANGRGGYVRGVEVSGAFEFGRLTGVLDGLGASGSVAYTESNLNPTTSTNSVVRIPGLSKWVYNITGYYEKNGFQARASYRYRSGFKGEVVALFTNLAYTEILADKQLDAQIGYSFQDSSPLAGLGIQLQVTNVLDSPYRTRLGLDTGGTRTSDGNALPETYEKFGRQWLLGLSYRF
ncbi:MAG: TonB-dependent receptor [Sphingomonadales bacterium]|nr:TonB-dependent receptor [Sphingomonadales bacterium]MBD3772070.1 TonB-dependent receptor [Paracoccaceae bacterium]